MADVRAKYFLIEKVVLSDCMLGHRINWGGCEWLLLAQVVSTLPLPSMCGYSASSIENSRLVGSIWWGREGIVEEKTC